MNKHVNVIKPTLLMTSKTFLALALILTPIVALAQTIAPANSLGAVAEIVIRSFSSLAKLITAVSYVAGMGFAIGSIMKFKAHKDNPTQVPVGTPIALIFIAAALIYLPTIFTVVGASLFGSSIEQQVGGVGGESKFSYGGF